MMTNILFQSNTNDHTPAGGKFYATLSRMGRPRAVNPNSTTSRVVEDDDLPSTSSIRINNLKDMDGQFLKITSWLQITHKY